VRGGRIAVDRPADRFFLAWKGKEDAVRILGEPVRESPEPLLGESVSFERATHLFFEGDNIKVLKHLHKEFRDAVSAIYIDPPYNTGQTIAFEDRYFERVSSLVPAALEGTPYHPGAPRSDRDPSPWLSLMYPRLILAHRLLSPDGALFVSIDDRSVHHLRVLLDEIFGPDNHVSTIVWRKKVVRGRGHRHVIPQTEYIVVYAKNIRVLPPFSEPLTKDMVDEYHLEDEEGPYKLIPLAKSGTRHSPRPNLVYPIEAPDGTWIPCPTHQWRWSESTLKARKDEVVFRKNRRGGWTVHTKQRLILDGRQRRKTPVSYYDRVTTTEGTRELKALFGDAVFDFPKPTRLVKDLLSWMSPPGEAGERIVLDFFGGTCTTAQAVLELNEEDGGRRRFIVIQDPGGETDRPNVAEFGKERIRKVITALERSRKARADRGGFHNLGFRVYRLSPDPCSSPLG
jgi:adenine-specific DNA-methyltransferase